MNEYEEACERFNLAVENQRKANIEADRILNDAENEYSNAERNLRKYEDRPGIPKREYRARRVEV